MIVLSGVYDLRFSFSQYLWDFASVSIFLVRYHFYFSVLFLVRKKIGQVE